MVKKNLISVLITNYNKSRFLTKSLKYICNQDFEDYEIILYDDASSDDSIKIIKRFKKIKLIENKYRIKRSAPLNQIRGILEAFKISKGNIICLMDADDFFNKSKLKKINEVFNKNTNFKSVFDFPISKNNKFILKRKRGTNSIWPTIFPTSCISVKRDFFKLFIKYLKKEEFNDLEIDARITIFSKFYCDNYNIIKTKLTTYNFDNLEITAKKNFFSKKWWFRRREAYQYMVYVLNKKGKNFNISFDFLITLILTFLLRKFL